MHRNWVALAITVGLVVLGTPVDAAPPPASAAPPSADPPRGWSSPVDGPVVRGYEPPKRPFGPHHLGLDFSAPPGTPVRAAADGLVAFAGIVARSRSVGVEHPGGRRTTYAYLRRVTVRPGTPVRRGDVLGISGGTGPGHGLDVVHFGYRVHGLPEDPAPLFQPERPRISLAPLDRPACPRPSRPAAVGPH